MSPPNNEPTVTPSSFMKGDRSSSPPLSSQRESMVVEELKVIMQQESTTYANRCDYISYNANHTNSSNDNRRKGITEPFRRKISEWSFEVVDHFGFDREVVSIALNYIDRVTAIRTLQADETMDRKEYQLIAVAALYIAIKLHGETDFLPEGGNNHHKERSKLEPQAFVELSRGLLNQESLQKKELEILHLLQWRMNPPTTVRIAAALLTLMPSWTLNDDTAQQHHTSVVAAIYEMASYLTELSLCVSAISLTYRPSEIAYASILCALETVGKKVPIPYSVRVDFTTKITAATYLTPASVAPVHAFLRNLQYQHPDMFSAFSSTDSTTTTTYSNAPTPQPEDDDLDRNTSPVCVVPNNVCPLSSPHKQFLYEGQ